MTVLTAGCLLIMEITGRNQTFESKSFLQLLYVLGTPILVWFLGIKARKTRQKNKLTYAQGFQEGMKISLTYSLTSPIVFLTYYMLVNPHIVGYVRTVYGLTNASNTTVIGVDLAAQLAISLLFGTMYSTIIPLFLQTKKKR